MLIRPPLPLFDKYGIMSIEFSFVPSPLTIFLSTLTVTPDGLFFECLFKSCIRKGRKGEAASLQWSSIDRQEETFNTLLRR